MQLIACFRITGV